MAQAQRLKSSWIRTKTVGDDAFWLNRLISQQSLQQHQSRLRVSPALDDKVQDLALIIDRAPEEHALAADRTDDLVQVPAWGRGGAKPLQSPGDLRAKFDRPAADGLVAHVYPARREQLFNIPETQAEAEAKPNGVVDDFRGKAVALER